METVKHAGSAVPGSEVPTDLYGQKVEFGVLGTLEYWQRGDATPLGGPKQRAVLALLIREVGMVVPAEQVITGVWGDDAPRSMRASLHTYISNLRVTLGGRIEHVGGGYRLDAEPNSIDANRFVDLADRAQQSLASDPGTSSDLLRQGLALWRGRPYADLIDVPGLQDEIRRLDGIRLAAVEHRIDADLMLGRHSAVAGELEVLVAQHPFRESLRARHMVALYRDGRQAEALRAFQRTRDFLIEELGLDPSPELQRLEGQILEHDPALLNDASARTDTVAFLFTDIVGSTSLWETRPTEMSAILAAHDEIMSVAVSDVGGRIFKHTGDGVLASFGSVPDAASAAAAIQKRVLAHAWGDIGSIEVRMSIDVGEVDVRGGDYFGAPLNRNARLVNAAHGSQILLSAEAGAALSEVAGAQIRTLGEYRLKGIGSPQRISQLIVAGLPQEFPDVQVDASATLEVRQFGDAIRGYELRERIDASKSATIYRAYQPDVGRQVAVKVIRPEIAGHPMFVRRFEAENRLLAKLSHPHILPMFDFWRDNQGAYVVSPYLAGRGLDDERYGSFPTSRTLEVVEAIGSALSYAHRQGVIHQRVTPSNVVFDDDGNPYLTDFGTIIHAVLDSSGGIADDNPYLAPEQHTGGAIDHRVDIYGLAAVAARMLLGSDPTVEAIGGLPTDVAKVLSAGLSPDPAGRPESIEAFVSAFIGSARGSTSMATRATLRNPYKGLAAFDETDTLDFFGRDAEVRALTEMIGDHRLATVVGPSGSGKSSLVRAGLIPAVRSTGTADQWLVVTMVPGAHPFDELATALSTVANDSMGDLAAQLRQDTHGLLRIVKRIGGDLNTELLLVIDQFEELYTLVGDDATRSSFIESLLEATEDPHSLLRVVTTIRADFFDKPLLDNRLGPITSEVHLALALPSREQLLIAIKGPAASAGLRLESGLAERIADDVAGEPGALPMMQFVLSELARNADGGNITWNDYQTMGGVTGALAQRAATVFDELGAKDQAVARQVMLRLVSVSEDADDVRRRVRRSELEGLGFDVGALDRVLDAFVSARLLTLDRDPITRGPTVEVAHEALLREWAHFRDWVTESRGLLIIRRRLDIAMAEWAANSFSDDHLPIGGRLAQFEEWSTDPAVAVTADEAGFLAAAIDHREAQRSRQRTRRRRIMATLAAAAIVSAVFAGVAWIQAGHATARELIAEAEIHLESDPELAILLALEAADRLDRFGTVPARVTDLLRSAMDRNHVVARAPHGSNVAVSDDGSTLVTVERFGGDGIARLWDPDTLTLLGTIDPVAEHPINDVHPRGVGDELYISMLREDGIQEVWAWSVKERRFLERLASIEFRPESTPWFDASPGGQLIAESTVDKLTVRDRRSGVEVLSASIGDGTEPYFLDDERLAVLVGGAFDRRFQIINTSNGSITTDIAVGTSIPGALFAKVSPAGDTVAVANQDGIAVFDLSSGDLLWLEDQIGRAFAPLWLPGDRIMIGGEGLPVVLDGSTGEIVLTLPGHRGGTWSYVLIQDTELVVSGSKAGGETLLYDLGIVGHAIPIETPLSYVEVAADGGAAVKSGHEIVALADDLAVRVALPGSRPQVSDATWGFPVFSSNAEYLGYIDDDGRSRLWAVSDSTTTYEAPDGFSIRGISAEGTGAIISRDGDTRVVAVPSGAIIANIDAGTNVNYATFSPDGRYLITGSDEPPFFRVWDRSNHSLLAAFSSDEEYEWMVVLTPDQQRIVSASISGTLRIYDFPQLLDGATDVEALVSRIDAHNDFILGLDISGDGRSVASVAWNEPARVFDLETGALLGSFGGEHPAVGLHPTKDLVYIAERGRLSIYDLDPRAVLDAARSSVTRTLTPAECEVYLRRSCEN